MERHYRTRFSAQFRQSDCLVLRQETLIQQGRKKQVMQARHDAEREQNKRRDESRLRDRYGKIGIEAVAAAVRCRHDERKQVRRPVEPRESD